MKNALFLCYLAIACSLSANFNDIVITNGLYPKGVVSANDEIFVTATNWSIPYVGVSQKISPTGEALWATETSGLLLTDSVFPPEYAFRSTPGILPSADGGAFFIYDYSSWVQDTHEPALFKTWPHIQKVSADGKTLWGRKGVQLSTKAIGTHGGSTILGAHFPPDGNILVFWNWFSLTDTLTGTVREYKVMMQKVNAATGDTEYGDGKILPISSGFAWDLLESDTQLYLLHTDSILCLDKNGQELWHKPLLQSIDYSWRYKSSTNHNGDIIIFYKTNDILKLRIFNSSGDILVNDKALGNLSTIFNNDRIVPYGNAGWLFESNGVHFVDLEGNLTWGDDGFKPPSSNNRHIAFDVAKDSSIYILDKKGDLNEETSLRLYKINKQGQLVWDHVYCDLGRGIGETYDVKALQNDAIVIYEGQALYADTLRPRGTFVQRVTRTGEIYTKVSVRREKMKDLNPDYYALAYPNPFKDSATIKLAVQTSARLNHVTIKIYDLLGREVFSNEMTTVFNCAEWRWDGKGSNGMEVTNGLYFYKILINNKAVLGKIVKGI